MGFGSVGSLGHNSEKNASDREITLVPPRTVPAGNFVVVWLASTGDSQYADSLIRNDPWAEIEDDEGNVWTHLEGGLSAGVGAVDYACYALFCCMLTHPLTTSSTITARCRNVTAAHGDFNAKAISAWEFTLDNGMVWASIDQMKVAREDPPAGDPRGGDIIIGGASPHLPSGTEFLLCHILANARPSTDSYTWDSDYTQIDADGTSSGGAVADVTLRGGFRIATLTQDTVNVSNATANSGVLLQGVVALAQVEYDADFPTFPFLDRFEYADQDPLPDPPWDNHTGNRPGSGTAKIQVISQQAARSTVGTNHGSMFLDAIVPAGDDGEIFATIAVVGRAGLRCFDVGSGTNHTLDGYGINWLEPVFAGHNHDYIQWGDGGFDGGLLDYLIRTFVQRTSGSKFGLQLRESGTKLHLWVDLNDGEGWRWVACSWLVKQVKNGGGFGLNFLNDFTTRIDDFGGGTSIKFIPHIIRRPPDPDGAMWTATPT